MSFLKIIFGLFVGLISYQIFEYHPFTDPIAAFTFITLTLPLLLLQIKLPSRQTVAFSIPFLIGMGLIYGYIHYRLFNHVIDGCSFALWPNAMTSAFIISIFYFVALEERCVAFPYQGLFNEAWKTILKLLLGTLFSLLIWGLFSFAAMLSDILTIQVIHEMVYSSEFSWIMPPVFFGIAMFALDSHEAILVKLRDILLVFCRYLYPLAVVISLLFLFVAPFSPKSISEFWKMIPVICSLNIVLFNGVFQAGQSKSPYATWFTPLIGASFIVMSVYSLYILRFPVSQAIEHGLDARHFLLIEALIILALYNIGYSAAWISNKEPWLGLVKHTNKYLALMMAVIYLIQGLFMTCAPIVYNQHFKTFKAVSAHMTGANSLPINNDYKGSPACYIACYSHQKEKAAYPVSKDIYVMGEIRIAGSYTDKGICYPTGFEGMDISISPMFKTLCSKKLEPCKGMTCWAGGDTGVL